MVDNLCWRSNASVSAEPYGFVGGGDGQQGHGPLRGTGMHDWYARLVCTGVGVLVRDVTDSFDLQAREWESIMQQTKRHDRQDNRLWRKPDF